MEKFSVHAVVIVAVLALAVSWPAVSAGQHSDTPAQFTPKQMEELVAKASTPAEHAQLRLHYLDMAALYTADADAHGAMAKASRRNPGNANRPAFDDPTAQMDRIAQRARDAAATARELATYHERLSAGAPKSDVKTPTPHPTMPMAQVDVVELIVTAKTSAEHGKLSKQFAAEAASYTADADRHVALAAGYRRNPKLRDGAPAVHCDRFVQQMRDAATAAGALAAYHERVAAEGGSK